MSTHPHRSITHKERYLHLPLMETTSKKYSHATIFARQENDKIWYATISLCWRVDQFCRETGRKHARRHYFDKKHIVYVLGEFFQQQMLVNLAVEKVKGEI